MSTKFVVPGRSEITHQSKPTCSKSLQNNHDNGGAKKAVLTQLFSVSNFLTNVDSGQTVHPMYRNSERISRTRRIAETQKNKNKNTTFKTYLKAFSIPPKKPQI